MTYEDSKMTLMVELDTQVSPITGENLYDEDGFISRMLTRDEPKELIKEKLEANPIFQANLEKMKEGPETADPMEKYMIDGFAIFYEALENLETPENPSDVRTYISELLAENYPNAKGAQEAIREGATVSEIFTILENDPAWKQDVVDYTTRMDVDIPTDRQKSRWAKMTEMKLHINDLSRYN